MKERKREGYWSVEEAAKHINNRKPNSLHYWVKIGLLQPYKFPKDQRTYFIQEEVKKATIKMDKKHMQPIYKKKKPLTVLTTSPEEPNALQDETVNLSALIHRNRRTTYIVFAVSFLLNLATFWLVKHYL